MKTKGMYQARLIIDNGVSTIIMNKTIKMVSSVDRLVPFLDVDPINIGSPAQFRFGFADANMSGWLSNVTFWPGDAINATQGPIDLEMNFSQNRSYGNLAYTYNSVGTFTAVFLVQNLLGQNATYFLDVHVVSIGISLVMSLSPIAVKSGNWVTINVFVVVGVDVSLNCFIDGTFFSTINVTCKSNFLLLIL